MLKRILFYETQKIKIIIPITYILKLRIKQEELQKLIIKNNYKRKQATK